MSLEKLIKSCKKYGLVMAIGAGVSYDSKIPNWKGLLETIAKQIDQSGEKLNIKRLQKKGFNLQTIASILESYSNDFTETVRYALYKDFHHEASTKNYKFRSGIKGKEKDFAEWISENNKTLNAIASFCAVKDEKNRYKRNPHVHAIINFNLDAVFRKFIEAKFFKKTLHRMVLVRTVERASKSSHMHKISVYYPHGYIRFDKKAKDPKREATDRIILTEQNYFDFYANPFGSFSSAITYLLREYPCLFMGLSMLDDNIRRLLHYSRKERLEEYEREGRKEKSDEFCHFAIMKSEGPRLDELRYKSLKMLGVEVIEIKKFNEIPDILGKVYNKACIGTRGQKWNSVLSEGQV